MKSLFLVVEWTWGAKENETKNLSGHCTSNVSRLCMVGSIVILIRGQSCNAAWMENRGRLFTCFESNCELEQPAQDSSCQVIKFAQSQ